MSAAFRPRHVSGKFSSFTVIRRIRVQPAFSNPINPLSTAAAYRTSTILWKLTSILASCVTPNTAHDAPAAKNRKLTIPSHTAAIR